jgi:hypothetical protein
MRIRVEGRGGWRERERDETPFLFTYRIFSNRSQDFYFITGFLTRLLQYRSFRSIKGCINREEGMQLIQTSKCSSVTIFRIDPRIIGLRCLFASTGLPSWSH